MQTPQQKRAKFALDKVKDAAAELPPKEQGEYKSYTKNLPFMIHANGLGQAAAFYRSKKGTHRLLYDLLSDWLTEDDQVFAAHDDLLEAITSNGMQPYFTAQVEAMELMSWVGRFADAFLQGEAAPAEDGGTQAEEQQEQGEPEGAGEVS